MTSPFFGLIATISLFIRGKVKFDRAVVGRVITMPDGARFTVFRRVIIAVPGGAPEPEAFFWVRFKPKGMGIRANIRFSRLPMMVFMGFTGFRSKYWAVDYETGLCQGLYEWQRVEDARSYSRSIAMRFMTRRSYPESVSFGVVDKSEEKLDYSLS